jgi:hypothetical protein
MNKNTIVLISQYQSLKLIQDFSGFFKLLNPLFFYRDVQMFLPNVLLWSESQNYIFSANHFWCFLKGGEYFTPLYLNFRFSSV